MQRPTRKSRAGVAALATLVLTATVAVFTTIGYGASAAIQYAPTNTAAPTVSGEAREGSTLTTTNGTWTSDSALAYSYRWQRCDSAGAACVDIAGATSQSYVVVTADVGKRLRSIVTASNSSGASSANSAPTAVVVAKNSTTSPTGAIRLSNGLTSVPASAVVSPDRLVVDKVEFSQSPIRSRNPLQARFRVVDTRGFVVRDALVYATAIPFGRIVQPAETKTDQEGWATITIQPTRLLPLRNGFLLTMFVRARKEGDDPLAGISTRRLISVRTANPAA